MASGSFDVSTNNQYIEGTLAWSSDPDTDGNYSDVTATLRLSRTNSGYTTEGEGDWWIKINGTTKNYSGTKKITYNSKTLIMTATVRVNHDDDGGKSIAISCGGGMPNTSYTSTSGGGTVALDTIPRASVPTLSDSSVYIADTVTIYTNRASSAFAHTLTYAIASASGTIATGVGASAVWAVPTALANQFPSAPSGSVTITCKTYKGSTLIGTKTVKLTVMLPLAITPTFTGITATELVSTVAAVGKYVQKLSNIRLAIAGAAGVLGSTITAYEIVYNGTTYNKASIDTGVIAWSGTKTITATITDSRGRKKTQTLEITALAYSAPKITAFTVRRCLSDGTEDELGTYAKIVRAGTAQSLLNGTQRNTVACKVYSRPRNGSAWSEVAACTVAASTDVTGAVGSSAIVVGEFPANASYDFRFDLTDKWGTTVAVINMATGIVVMSWGPSGVGIGKVWEQGVLDVLGPVYFDGGRMLPRKTLWSGTFSAAAGSITVPGSSNYNEFTVLIGADFGFKVRRNANRIMGSYDYYNGSNLVTHTFLAMTSGDVWTWGWYVVLVHVSAGNHQTISTTAVSAVVTIVGDG